MTVIVMDAQDKPVADAKVVARNSDKRTPYKTNANGVAVIDLPGQDPSLFVIYISGKFTPMKAVWWNSDAKEPDPIPEQFTFKVRQGRKISGRIVDEAGAPVADATVSLSGSGVKREVDGRMEQAWYDQKLKTNEEGVWSFWQAPIDPLSIYGDVTHPDFVDNRLRVREEDHAVFAKLFDGSHELTLAKGLTVRGTVTDSDGKPVANAKVLLGESFRDIGPWDTRTDDSGRYEFPNVRREPYVLTVCSTEFAPQLRKVNDFEKGEPVDFQLQKGRAIRFLVLDEKDRPIQGARIVYDTWNGYRTLLEFDDVLPQRTDEKGELVWDNAPPESVKYDVLMRDRMSLRRLTLQPRDEPHKIMLYRPLEISGKVVNTATKQPIRNFTVIRGTTHGGGRIYWDRNREKAGENGEYHYRISEPAEELYLKVEAADYKPAISRSFNVSDGKLTIDFEMERSKGIAGTVLDPKGKPIKGAKIYYSLPGSGPYVRNNAQIDDDRLITTISEMAGQFYLPEQETTFAIMVVADEGYAFVYEAEFKEFKGEIKVTPWATVRGKCMIGDKPAAGDEITMSIQREETGQGAPHRYFDYDTVVAADGTFELTRIPPDTVASIGRQIIKVKTGSGMTTTSTHTRDIKLAAGETLEVNIGGTGRPATGRLKLPDGDDRKVDEWNYGFTTLKLIGGPVDALHIDDTGYYSFRINPDGTFRVDDLPAGDYELSLMIREPGDIHAFDGPLLGTGKRKFTIPAMEGGRSDEPFEIGTIEIGTTKEQAGE